MSLVPAGLRDSPEFIAGRKADAIRGKTLLLRHIESGESIPRGSLPERQRCPFGTAPTERIKAGKERGETER